jgi:hypothetical protein
LFLVLVNIINIKGHPSARHSSYDWSSETERAKHPELGTALATEVVLTMGEVLYIPSYWFHYIVSQDASIQCNARSGSSEKVCAYISIDISMQINIDKLIYMCVYIYL